MASPSNASPPSNEALPSNGTLSSNGAIDDNSDSNVSPMTRSPVQPSSPLLQRPKPEHLDSQPRIASPLRMEQKQNGSVVATPPATAPTTATSPLMSSSRPAPNLNKPLPNPALTTNTGEFPFEAPPGTTGQSPTNELVQSADIPSEDVDIPTELAAPSNGTLSRKPTLEAGAVTPQGRRSVQFARPSTLNEVQSSHSRDASWAGENATTPGKEKLGSQLMSRLKSLASPISLQTHGRSLSNWTAGGDATNETHSAPMSPETEMGEPSFYEGDADAEESANENASLSKRKRRRKFRRDAEEGPSTAPTTPKTSKLASFLRDRDVTDRTPPTSAPHTRPNFPVRRNTMSDIPENQRLAFSEDEGRDRLAREGLWRRGSAWVQNHRGQSYTAAGGSGTLKHKSDDGGDMIKRPSGLRRLTGFGIHEQDGTPSPWRQRGERTTSVSAARWRQLKASLKMLGARKKEEHRIEHAKSAELMAELLAGAPAALFLASMFQRDEKGHKRIPVLLEQLRIKITDSHAPEGDRHQIFRMELEYASSLARMKWVVYRSLTDFFKLHTKYKIQSKTDKYIHSSRPSERSKIPPFPKSAFPFMRGLKDQGYFIDDEDGEEEEHDNTAGEQSTAEGDASEADRPGKSRRRSSFNFIRKKSSAPMSRNDTDEHGRAGSVTGLGLSGRRQETFAERQRRKLEEYVRKMVTYVMFRADSSRLCKFLELSALGVRLAAEGGYHGKEGFMVIKSSKGVDYRRQLTINLFKARHSPKWFLVRQSYVVCVDSPEEMNIYEVILVDSDFMTEKKKDIRKRDEKPKDLAKRAKDTAAHPTLHQLRISNSERLYKLLARNETQLLQFHESINFMKTQTMWSQEQRHESFAPVRENVWAQFLVDGRDYMWNVSRAINMARDVIYIHDWWLSPELYLRRPAAISQRWRLDRLLKKKADEGVKIYVIMYRNINSAIPIDSEYSKFSLLDLSENVFVQRSPNQLRQNTFFWAHHEKICIVDHCVAFCGGVDLCFGRWDTPSHTVADDKGTGFEVDEMPKDAEHCQLWPGKDYSNPRVQDFYALDKPYEEMYDRTKIPRMPWHDIGMQMVGQPARDLSRHFVQRWNFVLRQRTPTRPTPFLLPPTDFLPADIEALGLNGTCQIQILRSAGLWSLGTNKTECSIQNAYVSMIRNSDHFIYIENQFFITSCEMEGTFVENKIGDALVERIIRAFETDQDWRAVIIIPLMPGFQNTVDAQDGSSVRLIMQLQYHSINHGPTSIFARLRAKGIMPEDFIHFYALRSWGEIGPTKALVTEQLYIHAKCMIADDRVAIIGSANINERSMLGNRDSEVAAIVEDTDMIPSYMAGQPYYVGKFAHNLRVRLMREHLGIDVDCCLEEELNDEEWERQMESYDDQDDDVSSIASPTLDRITEQKLMDNNHSMQEELITRQEQLHSFNHDVDWAQQNNPNIYTNRKKTTDARVQGNKNHKKDVDGEGADNMIEIEREINPDQLTNITADGEGSVVSPKGGQFPHRPRAHTTPDDEPAIMPPPPLGRFNTITLGLPQLSQLPTLPVTDDTDIGGPPLQRSASSASHPISNPILADFRRPVVTEDCMQDPVNDNFFLDTWNTVAENNTRIFRQVFRCMPDNEVETWADYDQYTIFAQRFAQTQGAGDKNQAKAQQENVGKSGPPGNNVVNGMASVGKVVEEIHEKMAEKLPFIHADNDATTDNSARVHSKEFDEKDFSPNVDGPTTSREANGKESPTSSSSKGKMRESNGVSHSRKKRRRATTSSQRKIFRADDPNVLCSREEAEELLQLVQGHLVLWPYDWLSKEVEDSGWLYAVDKIAPTEI
jgi:phospholipase D1/2